MYIINGIAYTNETMDDIKVCDIEILDNLNMKGVFSTGEQRRFDATCMLSYPAFKALEDERVFKSAKKEYGVVTWDSGNVDLASETMYEKSYTSESVWTKKKR